MILSNFWKRRKQLCVIRQISQNVLGGVQLTENGLNDNGKEILHIETRNMCRCESCYGKHSHQKVLLSVCKGVKITEILGVTTNYISMNWSDGHNGLVARTINGAYGPPSATSILDKYYDISMKKNSTQIFWNKQTEDNFKQFNYDDVINSDEKTKEFLAHYMMHGIGFLQGIPEDRNLTDFVNLDLKIGYPRVTAFDTIDIVKFRTNPKNFAYSNDPLPGHLDLSYYNDSPAAQFFTCIKNTVEGGESFWIDTFAALLEVQKEYPEYFEILSKVPIFFRHDPPGTGRSLASSVPVLEMNGTDIRRVRDNTGSTDEYQFVSSTDIETRKIWWDAFTYYRSKIEDDSRKIKHRMSSGDIVITDNWRVLHGRNSFKATEPSQERIVATFYVDWNHLQSRLLSVSDNYLDLKC